MSAHPAQWEYLASLKVNSPVFCNHPGHKKQLGWPLHWLFEQDDLTLLLSGRMAIAARTVTQRDHCLEVCLGHLEDVMIHVVISIKPTSEQTTIAFRSFLQSVAFLAKVAQMSEGDMAPRKQSPSRK